MKYRSKGCFCWQSGSTGGSSEEVPFLIDCQKLKHDVVGLQFKLKAPETFPSTPYTHSISTFMLLLASLVLLGKQLGSVVGGRLVLAYFACRIHYLRPSDPASSLQFRPSFQSYLCPYHEQPGSSQFSSQCATWPLASLKCASRDNDIKQRKVGKEGR
jgi:hypothetical protein